MTVTASETASRRLGERIVNQTIPTNSAKDATSPLKALSISLPPHASVGFLFALYMTASAAAVNLSVRHIFGVNVNVADNLSFTDDDTIVYVAGMLWWKLNG